MLIQYHNSITREALSDRFSPRALEAVIIANLRQDGPLTGMLGHDEYHYDNNSLAESDRYLEGQRALTLSALQNDDLPAAWAAFGRLIHTAQDFYAHSNYVRLWLARFEANGQRPQPPSEIDPLVDELIRSPALCSGKLYYPWEALAFVPGIKELVIPFLPLDSHAHMQLDSSARGEHFAYAFEAARKRTRYEFDRTVSGLSSVDDARFFRDLP
jgi:hypothetical protein